MATLGYFRECSHEWEINLGLTASTGTRVFLEDGSFPMISLPVVGDKFPIPSSLPGIPDDAQLKMYCDNVKVTKADGHPQKHRYVFSYSTRQPSAATENPQQFFERSGQFGAEVISISGTDSEWKWLSDDSTITQKLSKRVGVDSFSIARRSSRDYLPMAWLRSTMLGRINDDIFEDLPMGTVLFEGVQFNEYKDDRSRVRFKINLQFRYRENSWLQLFRESTAEWDTPHIGNQMLYDYAHLNTLLRGNTF